jgi:hypothetical protein
MAHGDNDMPLDFPNAPVLNQTYTGPNGVFWSWDGAKWTGGTAGTAYAPIKDPVFTGNPQSVTPPSGDADTSVATTAFVSGAVAPAFNGVGRNLIHNPLFNVAQRGVGPWTSGYTVDRWNVGASGDTISFSQVAASDSVRSAIGDEAAVYLLQNVFTGNAGAGSYHQLLHPIEGARRLSGKTVTLSFWAVCASGALKIGINYYLNYGTGGSPSASLWASATGQSVTTSTTWTRYSVTTTIPSAIGKTLGSNNNDAVNLGMSCSSGATNNAQWGNIGVQSGTIQLWGVQLEVGSVATPLDYGGSPQQQFANCQRFYLAQPWVGCFYYASVIGGPGSSLLSFPVTMRATPTITVAFSSNSNGTGPIASVANGNSILFSCAAVAAGQVNVAFSFTASADL